MAYDGYCRGYVSFAHSLYFFFYLIVIDTVYNKKMKKYIVEQVRGRPKYLHIALNFQSDFPNLIDLRAIFSQSQGPQVLKGRKIPGCKNLV